MRFFTICLIQFIAISPGLPQNVEPAIKVTVSALGISKLVNITKNIAIRELPKLEIPVIKGEQDTTFGMLSYVAWNIKVNELLVQFAIRIVLLKFLTSPWYLQVLMINSKL